MRERNLAVAASADFHFRNGARTGKDALMRHESERPRAREAGVTVGRLPTGARNAITDVPGVRVGQHTLIDDRLSVRTGVTVVQPGEGAVFWDKPIAGVTVLNGYGKAAGLSQVTELGVLETPIALTNTLSVGAVHEGLVRHALAEHAEVGRSAGTVNPVVLECNDGWLNDIRALRVRPEHVQAAVTDADDGGDRGVAEGAVGAGTGMVSFGWKGGIGTSSRQVRLGEEPEQTPTVGVLVLANFGRAEDLTIGGAPVGSFVTPHEQDSHTTAGAGSCVVLIATDAPAESRQLTRIAGRAGVGLSRIGGICQHGSGEYALAFSVRERVRDSDDVPFRPGGRLVENGPVMDAMFRAVTEATEEAVLNALFAGRTTTGVGGHVIPELPIADVREVLARSRTESPTS